MQHNNNLLFRILMLFRNKILISEKKRKRKGNEILLPIPPFFSIPLEILYRNFSSTRA